MWHSLFEIPVSTFARLSLFTLSSEQKIVAARWPLAPDERRMAADAGVLLVIRVLRFVIHLVGESHTFLVQHRVLVFNVAVRTGRQRNIRSRNGERPQERDIDMTGRAARAVIRRILVVELD